nr:immunoglobulin light chain junction region [Macaca mulatta]MOX09412.1 immunoglobulin light chain junction region [Macaca mulatta]MOX10832.1 immunoglobulin light chain junction region [Macaca mulatta]MOX10842.1 immunoglobulin light chain junction region [Macaca mulatta]
CQQGNRDPPTF